MKNLVKLFFGFCVMLSLSQAIFAATYTVTKVADTNDGVCNALDCSLREAIVAANATADNDTIEFSASVFGKPRLLTIVLSGTDLIITNNGTLTINGTGTNRLFISGNNASRVFTISTGAAAEIKNLRVTGGNAVSTISPGLGGGIRNTGGTLTLTNVVVTENTATNGGGVSNGSFGTLNVRSCTISANVASDSGGGIQNVSGNGNVLNMLNSTISGNTSNSTTVGGGGIQANGVSFISNSTISGNMTTNDGGGIYYNGQGLTMHNTTIANNTAANQTGGFHKSITTNNANFRNNLFAGNTGGTSPDVSSVINSLGNNLIQRVGTSTGWIASDILNRLAQIGNLGDNGGLTQTHALEFNSPAIDAGNNCVINLTCPSNNPPVALTTDQREAGFPRLSGSAVDIGAFELANTCVCSNTPFDFDGDGRTDYGVFRPTIGTWFLNRSSSGLFSVEFGSVTDRITPVDFDGDGRTDIAVWRGGASGFFYILNSSDNTLRIEQFGTTGDDPRVVGDWDGDGKADPAVYRSAAAFGQPSFFFYRPSSQPGVNFVTIPWGIAGDEPLRGDFDGDNKLDAAVYRASDNTWYIRQSSNSQVRYARWGEPTDTRVEGDFDGDGKTDLVIFRNGLWGILLSSTGQQLYQRWGASGDRLVPGDYDGDGKTDFAVWRNGVFSILLSNGSAQTSSQFGATNDIPVASAFTRNTLSAPVAVISVTTASGPAPLTVNFSSQGSFDPDGSIVSYLWNFGDGTSSTDPNPVHVYNSAGTFTATLTVTDNNGATNSRTLGISVQPPTANYTLVATPDNVAPGGQITVSWTAPSGSSNLDWIGLFKVGTANSQYLRIMYTNGATSGSFNVTAPEEPGQYEFRYLLNNSFTSVKTSNVVKVNQFDRNSSNVVFVNSISMSVTNLAGERLSPFTAMTYRTRARQ